MSKTSTYKAAEGLRVVVPMSVKPAPGRRTLELSGDDTAELPDNDPWVVKRVRKGDLVKAEGTKAPALKATKADPDVNTSAPAEYKSPLSRVEE